MDKISVIIPTYNREKTIIKSIKSVLKQTYTNIEIIVVDDGSTDKTKEKIIELNNDKVKYIKLKQNHGACYARNVGIKKSSGKYIAFQDSDDIFKVDKLKRQLDYLKETNADICFCRMKLHVKNEVFDFPEINNYGERNWLISNLSKRNIISTQTIIAKKKVFNSVLFDENLPRLQDYDLVLRLARKYKISYLDEFLVDVYREDDNISSSDEKLKKACLYMIKKDYHIGKEKSHDLDLNLLNMYFQKEREEIKTLYNTLFELKENYVKMEKDYQSIINSKRWKLMDTIFNKFGK